MPKCGSSRIGMHLTHSCTSSKILTLGDLLHHDRLEKILSFFLQLLCLLFSLSLLSQFWFSVNVTQLRYRRSAEVHNWHCDYWPLSVLWIATRLHLLFHLRYEFLLLGALLVLQAKGFVLKVPRKYLLSYTVIVLEAMNEHITLSWEVESSLHFSPRWPSPSSSARSSCSAHWPPSWEASWSGMCTTSPRTTPTRPLSGTTWTGTVTVPWAERGRHGNLRSPKQDRNEYYYLSDWKCCNGAINCQLIDLSMMDFLQNWYIPVICSPLSSNFFALVTCVSYY